MAGEKETNDQPLNEFEEFERELEAARMADGEEGTSVLGMNPTPPPDFEEPPADDGEPAGDPQPEVDEPTEKLEEPGEPTPARHEGEMLTVPDDEFFGDLRGKKVSPQQLMEAGLLSKMMTRDHQVSHFQKLYESERERTAAIDERLKALEGTGQSELEKAEASPQVEYTPEQVASALQETFEPTLKDLAARGLIEPDYASVYPKKAALDAFYIDQIGRNIAELREDIASMKGRVGEWSEVDDTQKTAISVGTIMRGMIDEDKELYGRLLEEDVQTGFLKFLADDDRNPFRFEPEDATPEKMKAAWLLFHSIAGDSLPPATTKDPGGQKRMTSTSGGTGGRGSRQAGAELSQFEKYEQELEEANRKIQEAQ